MTDQPTNPTPNPDSDDAIRVSDNLIDKGNLKVILSPAQEPLPLGARVIVVRSFPNDHDLGMGDLGTVASLTDNPELWDKPGVQFDRAPYVIIKNPVMGHSIWEYVREVTKSPDPVPAWKQTMLAAQERRNREIETARQQEAAINAKKAAEAVSILRAELERLGITPNLIVTDDYGYAYWCVDDVRVAYSQANPTSFYIRPDLDDWDYPSDQVYTGQGHDTDLILTSMLVAIENNGAIARREQARRNAPQPKPRSLLGVGMIEERIGYAINSMRRLIDGVDRGELIDPDLVTILLDFQRRADGYPSPTYDANDSDLPFSDPEEE